jgi:hypothetical protein
MSAFAVAKAVEDEAASAISKLAYYERAFGG